MSDKWFLQDFPSSLVPNQLLTYKISNRNELERLNLSKIFLGDFQLLYIIATSANSNVVCVKHFYTRQLYVMKIMRYNYEKLESIVNEKKILKTISTQKLPHFVQTHSFFQTDSHIIFLMDFIEGVTLRKFIEMSKLGKFNEQKILFYTSCLIDALDFLHEANIFHRDLQSTNVLVDIEGYPKLVDFGMSTIEDPVAMRISLNTFRDKTKGDKINDLQDMGRLVWEMATGEKIYGIPNLSATYIPPNILKFLSVIFPKNEVTELLNEYQPIKKLKSHSFFKQIRWHFLRERRVTVPYKPNIRPEGSCPKSLWQQMRNSKERFEKLDEDFKPIEIWQLEEDNIFIENEQF